MNKTIIIAHLVGAAVLLALPWAIVLALDTWTRQRKDQ